MSSSVSVLVGGSAKRKMGRRKREALAKLEREWKWGWVGTDAGLYARQGREHESCISLYHGSMLASGASTTQDVEPTDGIKYVKGVITDADGIRTTAALTVQVSKPSETAFNSHASTAVRSTPFAA